ncbi:hypothetical protein QBZ16_000847 [Prototheca wickerhamii]|uniref:EIF3d n=1 Tax=Prototheca wickerhamii TaxID=3111 RepID=A0AAD9MKG6_PROWI|nr:hypothetical protein QBZ16_000847 [Prototheca wickerhamii]
MPGFKLPPIEQNDEDWGPTSVPEQWRDVPFVPFNKSDRLGRIADFSAHANQRAYQGRYRERELLPGMAVFNFEKADEDGRFELVDTRTARKSSGQQGGRGRGGRGWAGRGPQTGGDQGRGGRGGGRGGRGNQWGGRGGQWRDQNRPTYSASVDIRPEWRVLGDAVAFSSLLKLSARPAEPEDVAVSGALAVYDRAADRVTPRSAVRLARSAASTPVRRQTTSSSDPILRALAASGAGHVFCTDELLTTLMTAPRSVYPWDIVVTRRGDKIFLDKRAGSSLDFVNNGETSPDPIVEDRKLLDGVQQLSAEATAVNAAFAAQTLSAAERARARAGGPRGAGAAPPRAAREAYRYRKWELGDIDLVVRCAIDGAVPGADGAPPALVAVHAFNEFDPKWSGVDWRAKLENQRGAALATELKNNAAKVGKWTAAAIAGGVDLMKIGYVTRASLRSNEAHLLLATQTVKPADFATQMNLSMDNAWGIVRALLDLFYDAMEEDGTYLVVRDPSKPQLRLYQVTPSAKKEAVAEGEEESAGAAKEEADAEDKPAAEE